MGNHSENYWNGRVEEDNFGGGDAGAPYAETEPANTAALTAQNMPLNEKQINPVKEYAQVAQDAAGQTKSEKRTITGDTTVLDSEKHQYTQNTTWAEKAFIDGEHGLQKVNVGGAKTLETATGLAGATQYYGKVN